MGASAAAQSLDVLHTGLCVLFCLQQWQPLRSADPSTEPSASADAELVRQAAARVGGRVLFVFRAHSTTVSLEHSRIRCAAAAWHHHA